MIYLPTYGNLYLITQCPLLAFPFRSRSPKSLKKSMFFLSMEGPFKPIIVLDSLLNILLFCGYFLEFQFYFSESLSTHISNSIGFVSNSKYQIMNSNLISLENQEKELKLNSLNYKTNLK